MVVRLLWCTLLVAIVPSYVLLGQGIESEPAWLTIERGRKAIREGDIDVALSIFRSELGRGVAEDTPKPEAEFWIGYIFELEGELELAERQYLRALERKNHLYSPEDAYTILYRLAFLYEMMYKYGSYEATLTQVLDMSLEEQSGEISSDRGELMYSLLEREGLNRVLLLYRSGAEIGQVAFRRLGKFYYQTGRYRESIVVLLDSLVISVSTLIEHIREHNREYEFISLETLLFEIEGSKLFSSYLSESGFSENLYYLAASLFAQGEVRRSREVWSILLYLPEGNFFREKAVQQLAEPYIEPLLFPQD